MGPDSAAELIRWFDELSRDDVAIVGGKNASLGEMIGHLKQEGVCVPDGFATTADAYRAFLEHNNLTDRIRAAMDEHRDGAADLAETGEKVRGMVRVGRFPPRLRSAIQGAYENLCERCGAEQVDVAVRSSATAEDLPEASFAGQQESVLNIRGGRALLNAVRRCFASLFTDRAISYREQRGFDHMEVALSVGVQKMVRSDRAGAGVMFTIDTETGFPGVVVIDAAWGIGESVVAGTVNPDELRIFKPALDRPGARPIIERTLGAKESMVIYGARTTKTVRTPAEQRGRFVLSDEEALQLARWAAAIERHYERPMDIEWAKDGESGELFIVQARPETVVSRRKPASLQTFTLTGKGRELARGQAVGSAIGAGQAQVIFDIKGAEAKFETGSILVTDMTDPDWVPVMKRAAGIVTDHGGRTSHAAIVSRELGVPAVVGTGSGTHHIPDGEAATLSCAEGETGRVYEGRLDFERRELDLSDVPATRTHVMMNLASPEAAFRWWQLPADGVGLARMEFIINNAIKIHPLALTRFERVTERKARRRIEALTEGYDDKPAYFVERLAQGIAMIAASQHPDPVIVRLSDFKTNEYANLIGGAAFEPHEANPMLGFRGASRYYSDHYRDGFALECRAIKMAREQIGLDNVIAMVPFCRTPDEGDNVLGAMAEHGLKRGEAGFQVYVMAEIPSNVILADEFAERFDGFSIGSNDLTQLTLGIDRDSDRLAPLFDDRHRAVRKLIRQLIETAHEYDRPVGFCGQAPSDHPEYAGFLVECGIDSISVNPDSVLPVRNHVAQAEANRASAEE